jgi:hypothetical protein
VYRSRAGLALVRRSGDGRLTPAEPQPGQAPPGIKLLATLVAEIRAADATDKR